MATFKVHADEPTSFPTSGTVSAEFVAGNATTVYYAADEADLEDGGTGDGSLTKGDSVALTGTTWFRCDPADKVATISAEKADTPDSPLFGTSDSTKNRILVVPQTDSENAVTVKVPSSTWGVSGVIPYGNGQAFMVLKDSVAADDIGHTGVTPDDYVVARIDRRGGAGFTGLHVAQGFRQEASYTAPSNVAVWVENYVDCIGLVLQAASDTPSESYLLAETLSGTAVFEVNSDGRAEFNVPQARVYNKGDTALTSGTNTTLTFDSERFDTAGMHEGVTHPDRLTAPVAGIYQITGHVEFAANSTGVRQISIATGGAAAAICGDLRSAASAGVTQCSLTTIYKLAAGDYAILNANQTSGGSLSVKGDTNAPFRGCEFMMTYLGRGN